MEATKKKGRGGAGRGQGRKKGTRDPQTLEKEKVAEALRQRIFKMADKLASAQYSVAKGSIFVYRIDEVQEGKHTKRVHTLVEDPKEIEIALNNIENGDNGHDDHEYYYVTTKEPDWKAADALLNRGLGKPTESLEVAGKDGQPMIIIMDR